MAQKVNPIAVRQGPGLNRFSDSNWFSDYYYSTLFVQDYQIRYYLNRSGRVRVNSCGFKPARCVIHYYPSLSCRVFVFCLTVYEMQTIKQMVRPTRRNTKRSASSVCVNPNHSYFSHLQSILSQYTGSRLSIIPIQVQSVYQSASLLAQAICTCIEQNKSFRFVCKTILKEIEAHPTIQGIRIACSGRLNGAEIAKTECQKYGQTSLHVFSDRIDYAALSALTPYGILGVKVWISYAMPWAMPNCVSNPIHSSTKQTVKCTIQNVQNTKNILKVVPMHE